MTHTFLTPPAMRSGTRVGGTSALAVTVLHIVDCTVFVNWSGSRAYQTNQFQCQHCVHYNTPWQPLLTWLSRLLDKWLGTESACLTCIGTSWFNSSPSAFCETKDSEKNTVYGMGLRPVLYALLYWWTLWIQKQNKRSGMRSCKAIQSGGERGSKVWGLISVMCRDSWAMMSVQSPLSST